MVEPIRDATFGSLEWDGLLECWLGGVDWPPGLHTEVVIWQPDGDPAAGLQMARESFDWLKQHVEQAHRLVAREMVGVYNDAWRCEREPMTEDEFVLCTELVRIGFTEVGGLRLAYDSPDDPDLFGGHGIDADFKPDRSYDGATLIG